MTDKFSLNDIVNKTKPGLWQRFKRWFARMVDKIT